MAYEFKNLNAVDMIEETNESTTVLGIHEGNIVQMPAGNMGGGGAGLLFEITEEDLIESSGGIIIAKSYDPIYETLLEGGNVVFKIAAGVFGISDEISFFCTPVFSGIQLGNGFAAFVLIAAKSATPTMLVFPNGSYHN